MFSSKKVRNRVRRLRFETLCKRLVLAGDTPPFATHVENLDVNGDDVIAPIDALLIINELNRNGAGVFNPFRPGEQVSWWDVSGDGWVTPIDALHVINFLNAHGSGPAPKPALGNLSPVGYSMNLNVQEAGSVSFVPAFIDPEGVTLNVGSVFAERPQHGMLTVHEGTWTYEADGTFQDDSFTLSASDGVNPPVLSHVTVHVILSPGPHAPVAFMDQVSVQRNAPKEFNVLANDKDADGDTLSVVSHTMPENGNLEDLGNGHFRFTPNVNFTGSASFNYTIKDPSGLESTAAVVLNVNVNQAPVVSSPTFNVVRNTPSQTFGISNLGTDAESDPLTVTFGSPTHGSIQEVQGGYRYVPDVNFLGTDSASYALGDGNQTTNGVITFVVSAPHFTGPIQRDEAVFVGVTLSGVTVDNETTSSYVDITPSSYAFLQIEEARDHNWIQNGFAVGENFYPGRALTLGESALLVVRVYSLPGPDFVSAAIDAGVLTQAQSNRLGDQATTREFWKMWAQGKEPGVQDEATLEQIAPDIARQFGATY